jgi:hypothetical protein
MINGIIKGKGVLLKSWNRRAQETWVGDGFRDMIWAGQEGGRYLFFNNTVGKRIAAMRLPINPSA